MIIPSGDYMSFSDLIFPEGYDLCCLKRKGDGLDQLPLKSNEPSPGGVIGRLNTLMLMGFVIHRVTAEELIHYAWASTFEFAKSDRALVSHGFPNVFINKKAKRAIDREAERNKEDSDAG